MKTDRKIMIKLHGIAAVVGRRFVEDTNGPSEEVSVVFVGSSDEVNGKIVGVGGDTSGDADAGIVSGGVLVAGKFVGGIKVHGVRPRRRKL
jgi:hypothetical protein